MPLRARKYRYTAFAFGIPPKIFFYPKLLEYFIKKKGTVLSAVQLKCPALTTYPFVRT